MLLSEFHLYRAPRGVVAVSGEKMRLMALLRGGSMEFWEIVEALGRDKSTVSVHLRELEEAGLVSSHSGLRDRRLRVYRCEATLVLSAGDGRDPGVSLARVWAASLGQTSRPRPSPRRTPSTDSPEAAT
ncbi:MAG: helix-turn-helix transcriptional regulator [Euryarchaeota archaeon]|nr:helix-turn-helix transcriptional regulator [Euryarchaeota archaeon]